MYFSFPKGGVVLSSRYYERFDWECFYLRRIAVSFVWFGASRVDGGTESQAAIAGQARDQFRQGHFAVAGKEMYEV